jgi:hypothetical protein
LGYKVLFGRPEGNSGHSEDVGADVSICPIEMDLRKIGLEGEDWIHLAQDRER